VEKVLVMESPVCPERAYAFTDGKWQFAEMGMKVFHAERGPFHGHDIHQSIGQKKVAITSAYNNSYHYYIL
jgi:hypothetical protein